jgi:hypothetical protein
MLAKSGKNRSTPVWWRSDKAKETGADKADETGPRLVSPNSRIGHYVRRFPITSKYQRMHGVLNVDEIKN